MSGSACGFISGAVLQPMDMTMIYNVVVGNTALRERTESEKDEFTLMCEQARRSPDSAAYEPAARSQATRAVPIRNTVELDLSLLEA